MSNVWHRLCDLGDAKQASRVSASETSSGFAEETYGLITVVQARIAYSFGKEGKLIFKDRFANIQLISFFRKKCIPQKFTMNSRNF